MQTSYVAETTVAVNVVVMELLQKRTRSYVNVSDTVDLHEGISLADMCSAMEKDGYGYQSVYPNTIVFHRGCPDSDIVTISGGMALTRRHGRGRQSRVSFWGHADTIIATYEAFVARFGKAESTLGYASWHFANERNQLTSTRIKLSVVERFHPEFYPSFADVDGFIDGFLASDSNVLILNGDPGLGKSTFLKYMIDRARWNVSIAYDKEVMGRDDLYTDFISGGDDALILEDADLLLAPRLGSDNHVMSKVLNISDGILDGARRKYVFTANLQKRSDIDDALTRPGRCYGILQFEPLTREQAEKAAAVIGKTLPDAPSGKTYTVAEIYASGGSNLNKLQSMGFRSAA